MPRAGTNQHRALSVCVDAKRRLRSSAATGQKTKPRDFRHHPSQLRCPPTLRDGMSSIQQRASIDVPGLMHTGKIVWMYHILEIDSIGGAHGSKVHSPQIYTRG